MIAPVAEVTDAPTRGCTLVQRCFEKGQSAKTSQTEIIGLGSTVIIAYRHFLAHKAAVTYIHLLATEQVMNEDVVWG